MRARLVGAAAVLLGLGSVAALVFRLERGMGPSSAEDGPQFSVVHDQCDLADFTPVFEIAALSAADRREPDNNLDQNQTSGCTFDNSRSMTDPSSRLSVVAAVADTAEAAQVLYDSQRMTFGLSDGPDRLTRNWDDNAFSSERTDTSTHVRTLLLDGTLVLHLELGISSGGALPPLDAQQAALVEVAMSMRDDMRR